MLKGIIDKVNIWLFRHNQEPQVSPGAGHRQNLRSGGGGTSCTALSTETSWSSWPEASLRRIRIWSPGRTRDQRDRLWYQPTISPFLPPSDSTLSASYPLQRSANSFFQFPLHSLSFEKREWSFSRKWF